MFLGTRRIREYFDPKREKETYIEESCCWVHGASDNI